MEYNGRVYLDGSDVGEPPRVAARGRSPRGESTKTADKEKNAHALGDHASDNEKMSSALSLPILTIGRCMLAACAASPLHGLVFLAVACNVPLSIRRAHQNRCWTQESATYVELAITAARLLEGEPLNHQCDTRFYVRNAGMCL